MSAPTFVLLWVSPALGTVDHVEEYASETEARLRAAAAQPEPGIRGFSLWERHAGRWEFVAEWKPWEVPA